MTSVSEVARDIQRTHATAIPPSIPDEQQSKLIEQLTIMQGSIWQYSDSQPWFIVGLHKNNPTATREALESIMRLHIEDAPPQRPSSREKRRGTVSMRDGREDQKTLLDSQGRIVFDPKNSTGAQSMKCAGDLEYYAEAKYVGEKLFSGSPETKIVIKKTVELIGDMSKSCELVFHAIRACARFLTYPTPSVPSDNFVFGHLKGWVWLIQKGLVHFNHQVADRNCLDATMKTFRREMGLLAKQTHECGAYLTEYLSDLTKLNLTIRKEAMILKKKLPNICGSQMDRYFRFADEIKNKRNLLVDASEDRFFPTDWLFEPHPSQTKLKWDFFHFQWVNMSKGWVDELEFEVRSDYSLHWKKFTDFAPEDQKDIIVHLIHHLRALVEETHHFHKENLRLSFDSQEIKFLKFSLQEIAKLKRHRDSIVFIASVTKKLFEDLIVLQRISEEYVGLHDWVVSIVEPCYSSLESWLAEELILPLEYRTRMSDETRCCGSCFRRKKRFHELFGEPLKVVLLRTPISMDQLERFFPAAERIDDAIPPSADINAYGLSTDYPGSIFDAGLGRDQPLPLTHPLPRYKKPKKRKQTRNIFDITRLIEATASVEAKLDTEKYLVLVEEVQRFLAVFATIFSYITAELKEKVEVLETLMYSNLPEHYESVEKLIAYEKLRSWDNVEKSGTRAIARLHRIFQFVVYFLERVNGLEDNETTFYAAKLAYYRSYGKSQSWIYQKAMVFSMYALPHKNDMYNSLFTEPERNNAAKNVKLFVEVGCRLIDVVESMYRTNGILIP